MRTISLSAPEGNYALDKAFEQPSAETTAEVRIVASELRRLVSLLPLDQRWALEEFYELAEGPPQPRQLLQTSPPARRAAASARRRLRLKALRSLRQLAENGASAWVYGAAA
jgi:hypothetical protein